MRISVAFHPHSCGVRPTARRRAWRGADAKRPAQHDTPSTQFSHAAAHGEEPTRSGRRNTTPHPRSFHTPQRMERSRALSGRGATTNNRRPERATAQHTQNTQPAGAKALSFVPSQRTLVPRSRFFAVLDTSILSGKPKIQKGQRSIPTRRFTPLGMTINKFILRRATCSSVVILRRAPEVPDVRIDRFAYHHLAAKNTKETAIAACKVKRWAAACRKDLAIRNSSRRSLYLNRRGRVLKNMPRLFGAYSL